MNGSPKKQWCCMNKTTIDARLAQLEAQTARRSAHLGYDLSLWTDEQLEAALCLLTGKPPGTRLTDEQLRAIVDGEL